MEIVISEIIYEASTDDTDKKAGVEVTQMDEEFADMVHTRGGLRNDDEGC